ncbi:AI-2E family transporter [Hydrogenimonas urashimensis]|uniref:AI-2E family transporter n=1 Tax=Hydrogenimonas urashimensis TaxID=2740515 RepID=UPI0019168CCC|nr:AI-2E family transporter [Hydrogenimonas urashimensis]
MSQKSEEKKVKIAIEIAIKLGFLFLVLYISYLIVKPFLALILWGIILAVAFEPLVMRLQKRFGERKKVVIAMTAVMILALVIPAWSLSDNLVASTSKLLAAVNGKEQIIPPPTEQVKSWPLVGDQVYNLWNHAHNDWREALAPFKEQIKVFILKLISMLKSAAMTLLLTVVSLIVAAIFLIGKEANTVFYHRIMRRILGERGDEWADISVLTIRSVATGVVGVAIIQSTLALVGMIVMGVPMAPLWALIIMFLTIIQLPALIVIGPIIAYVYSYVEGFPATVFALYMLIVGASDGVLKPLLMGRGVDLPMLVILIGAIGGMMLMGMIGLFLGAVILALTYKLFYLWLAETETNDVLAANQQ